jgi:hypothetical protein
MKTIITLLLAFVAIGAVATAQPHQFFNAGVRLGWVFGEHGGPVAGVELSYTFVTVDAITHGPVLGADYHRGGIRLHPGYEFIAPYLPVGLDVGPSIRFGEEPIEIGAHVTAFAGLYAIPYFSATILPSATQYEAGTFLKLPTQTSDRPVFK